MKISLIAMDGNVVDKSRKCNGTEEPIYLFLIINLLVFFLFDLNNATELLTNIYFDLLEF